MVRVAVVTDSTADLPPELQEQHGITVVPLTVHFGEESFRDQIDISTDDFMERLQRSETMPTTSQPSSGLFEDTFRQLAADHDEIIAVFISSKLSGTVMSAMLARDAVTDLVPVEIVDSQSASMALGFQALAAARYAAQGLGATAIAQRLRSAMGSYETLFFVDTLEYLRRGGRIGKASAMVGSFLDLKPMLRIDEGQVVPAERTRTRARARKGLVDFVRAMPNVERLAVMHATTQDEAVELAEEFDLTLPRENLVIARFGPVIGTHVGPGAMGVIVDVGSSDA
ncbi:MAG TPA: DegV family protein [Thermomicrobiales bacterium]|nr:DegV family protein [Thermomicrobiales bacterium]